MPTRKNNSKNPESGKPPFPLRLAAWLLSAFIVIPTLAVLALHIPTVQKEIIRRVVDGIEAATYYKVQLDSYKWWPFSRLYLSKVKVQAQGKEILSCDQVNVKYNLSAAWPYMTVKEIYLEKPFLQLERSAEGKWQIPEARAGSGKSQGSGSRDGEPIWSHIVMPTVQIVSGTIEARQQGNTILSVKDISGAVHLKTVQGSDGHRIRVDFENLHAQSDAGKWGTWSADGSGSLSGNDISIERVVLSKLNGGRAEITGKWNAQHFESGKLDLLLSGFSASDLPEATVGVFLPGAISGCVQLSRESGEWTLLHDIRSESGYLQGTVKLEETGGESFQAVMNTRFTGLNIRGPTYVPEMSLNGNLDLSLRVQNRRLTQARFDTDLDSSRVGSETIRKCDLSGSYEKDILSIKSSTIKSSIADITLTGKADLAGLWNPKLKGGVQAEIKFDKANLEKVNSGLQQRLGGKVSIEANYSEGNFRNFLLWQAKADSNLNIPELLSLKASGTYQAEQLKVDYDLDCKDTQKITAFFPIWQGKGRAVSRGNLTGRWPDLVWEGEISWPRFQYADVQADQLGIKGKGKISGKDDRRELTVKVQNLNIDGRRISSLNAELDQQKSTCSFQIKADGVLNQISAKLSGRVDRIWEFPLVSVSTQGQLGWKDQTGSVDCKFDIEKDAVRINSASLQQGKQKIAASGGLISDSKAELHLSVESINTGQIIAALGIKEAVSGTVSGQIVVSGKPEQPECKMTLQGTNFQLPRQQQVESLQIQGHYIKDNLSIQGEAKTPLVQAPLAITARVPMRLSFKPFLVEVKQTEEITSDVKVAALNAEAALPFLPFLSKLGGRIQGDIHLGGTLRQPVISGFGTWKNGLFQQTDWAHLVDDIQGEWQADSKNLYVTKAEVSHLGGKVSITGFINFPQFNTLSFKAQGTDLLVHDIYGIEGKVSGYAEISDTPNSALLTGTLNFSNAKMSLGQLEMDIVQNIQIIDSDSKGGLIEVREVKGPSKFANRLRMDVGLVLPPAGTMVTGKGLKAEIAGGLKLEKAPAGPIRLAGELQALRGTYTFQGKELKIVEGSLVFTGTPQPDPQLRIVCQKQVRDITLQAIVSGPLSKPKLAMSSMPAMNQVDIVSYFMFEHAAGDLNATEKVQMQDKAASWFGSETSGIIKRVFGDSPLAPDAVRYRTYTGKAENGFTYNPNPVTTSTGKESGIVEIGKQVTPDLYVTYGRGVKGDQNNEVQIEYRVNRHLSVQTQVGGADQSGVDIFWRHDFGK